MDWNIKEAARECGLPAASWRTWERDGVTPRRVVEITAIISDRTGCDYGWLLAGSRLRSRPDPGTITANEGYRRADTQPATTARPARPTAPPQPKRRPHATTSPGRATPKDTTRRPARLPRPVTV